MSTMTIAPQALPRRPARPRRTSRSPGRRQVRLTRRGRLVVFVGALLVVLALGVFWGAGSVATERPGTPEPTRGRHGRRGRDPLGHRRRRPATDGDTGAMVERIQELNALDSGMLTAGQKIRVPAKE